MNRKQAKLASALALWALLLGLGFWQLLLYSQTPGKVGEAPHQWPQLSRIARSPHLSHLLVFVHPRCPCSAATLQELARLTPRIRDKIQTTAIFYQPQGQTAEWTKDRLWEDAQQIPGVNTLIDDQGTLATLFGVETSGQVLVYNPQGALAFHGGITPARGHGGDSVGRDAILAYVATGHMSTEHTATFGCSLRSPERAIAGGHHEHD